MAIKTIREPDVYLTESEMAKLRREWEATQQYTTAPCSFDEYVRQARPSGAAQKEVKP